MKVRKDGGEGTNPTKDTKRWECSMSKAGGKK